MLQKCMRSCNLCGDLVDQKDRIQPTSKKPFQMRRPPSSGGGGGIGSRLSPTQINSEYNDFQSYYHSMIGQETSTASSAASITLPSDDYHENHEPHHQDLHPHNDHHTNDDDDDDKAERHREHHNEQQPQRDSSPSENESSKSKLCLHLISHYRV